MASEAHSLHSTRREKILESLLVGEILKEFWQRKEFNVELLHSDIDSAGYDLVLSFEKGIRYIQLKSFASKNWRTQKVNAKITDKSGGCVLIMRVTDDLDFNGFYWFGAPLGLPCPDLRKGIKAKHARGNKDGVKREKSDSHKLNKSACQLVEKISDVVDLLVENYP